MWTPNSEMMLTEIIMIAVSHLNLDAFVRRKFLNFFAVDIGHLTMLCLVLSS